MSNTNSSQQDNANNYGLKDIATNSPAKRKSRLQSRDIHNSTSSQKQVQNLQGKYTVEKEDDVGQQ
jgi:hypothetical protein